MGFIGVGTISARCVAVITGTETVRVVAAAPIDAVRVAAVATESGNRADRR